VTHPTTIDYPGNELGIFSHAVNWKAYFARSMRKWIKGHVLEVGAGIGETTRTLKPAAGSQVLSWTCLEPDPSLASQIAGAVTPAPQVIVGTLQHLPPDRKFDTILYIDVLEHIQEDSQELALAAARLNPGGHIICLSPAYMFLYSDFDKALHHFRRYTASGYHAVTPPTLLLEKTYYLDILGCLLSLGNRLLSRQSTPKKSHILFWDRVIVPISIYLLDPITLWKFGRSVIGVWKLKTPNA
jgi:SAM-dependent methyltransferase